MRNPSQNYRVSFAIWDHTVLLATQHKQTHPTLTQPQPLRLVLDLPTPEGWKAELSWLCLLCFVQHKTQSFNWLPCARFLWIRRQRRLQHVSYTALSWNKAGA